MPDSQNHEKLVAILQLAYSGELAAGFAYRGHWHSVKDPDERERIHRIEEEEWHHRRLVGDLLRRLGTRPRLSREIRAFVIGRTLGALCHVAGWFAPMYGAGKLESRNVKEYVDAAAYAADSGHREFVDCLLTMAEVEWEHERYFRGKVETHPWIRRFPLWESPPPKETIRAAHHGLFPPPSPPRDSTSRAEPADTTGQTQRPARSALT